MFTWNLARYLKQPWPNAHQFSRDTSLSYPVAVRVLKNEPMARLDGSTLGILAKHFGVSAKNAHQLYTFTPRD